MFQLTDKEELKQGAYVLCKSQCIPVGFQSGGRKTIRKFHNLQRKAIAFLRKIVNIIFPSVINFTTLGKLQIS